MEDTPRTQLRTSWNIVPKSVRFMISGGIGNFLFYNIDRFVYSANPYEWQKSTVSWAVSYLISIWFQHFLHMLIVFGRDGNGYWKSLIMTYATYSLSIVSSPVANALFINTFSMPHSAAWFATLTLTGVFNYFAVSSVMDKPIEIKEK